MTSDLEQFQFAEAPRRLRDFTWGGFCDWYVEFVKGGSATRRPVRRPSACWPRAPDGLCRLLHPIMPFVTEQVWQGLASLAPVRGLPAPEDRRRERLHRRLAAIRWAGPMQTARQTVEQWCEAIKAIRNLRAERNVPKEAKIAPIIVAQGTVADWLRQGEPYLRSLPPAESVTIVESVDRPAECAVAVLPEVEIILPLAGLIDKEAERAKQRKALADLERQIGGHRGQAGQRVVRGAGPRRGRRAGPRQARRARGAARGGPGSWNSSLRSLVRCVDALRPVLYDRKYA